MKLYIFLLILLSIFISGIGQKKDSLISLRQGIFGLRFVQQDKKMNFSKVSEVMQTNEEAYKYIKSARNNQIWGYAIGMPGGALLGYWLAEVSAIFIKPHYEFLAGGAAMSITSAILSIKSKNQAERAVEVYNEDIRKIVRKPKELRFGFYGTGVSIAVGL